ncbi:MBL fold metallo-hydrolase [Thomasclavelia ramosa]|uniref:MBL fold metallo-hydrolase n=1 Tax=Thomasclavelia ramosa TaxID=1547 RepID=UPI0032BFA222
MLSIGKENQYNILIDGGLSKTYQKYIKSQIQHIKEKRQKIGLLVCTHMDNDHICGLIQVLKEMNSDFIDNVWYNGFLQIVNSRFYSQKENSFTDRDNKILDEIISQGVVSDAEQEIGINEGMSLGVLIEESKIPLNLVVEGRAICSELVENRYEIATNIFITVLGPSINNIIELEDHWKKEMVSRNYMFRVSDKIKLTAAFEYQIERIKSIYTNESFKICENEDLTKYIGDLSERDESIVNRSSISFILEYNDKKYLFLGDTVIDKAILKNIENVVGFEYRFSAIKLPHHGSRYNITHDFISRYSADEYYCLTNSIKYGHPDLEVLATILCKDSKFKKLIFNYPINKAYFLNKEEWKEKYNYEVIIGNGKTIVERIFE